MLLVVHMNKIEPTDDLDHWRDKKKRKTMKELARDHQRRLETDRDGWRCCVARYANLHGKDKVLVYKPLPYKLFWLLSGSCKIVHYILKPLFNFNVTSKNKNKVRSSNQHLCSWWRIHRTRLSFHPSGPCQMLAHGRHDRADSRVRWSEMETFLCDDRIVRR